MKFTVLQPSDCISDFIRFYWILESEEPYTHFTMADVFPELIFHYKGSSDECLANGLKIKSFTSHLHGQNNIRRVFKNTESFGIFGVYFYPYAIPLFFNIPAVNITNELIDLNEILGQDRNKLEEDIMFAGNHNTRVNIIESFFKSRLSSMSNLQTPIFEAIKIIIINNGLLKVDKLVNDYFFSERQFERQFLKYSGFNPKYFSRIVRFHSAMEMYGNKHKSLTEIALQCGYYDQSHFINDFKEFSGLNPKQFFSGNSEATVWRD